MHGNEKPENEGGPGIDHILSRHHILVSPFIRRPPSQDRRMPVSPPHGTTYLALKEAEDEAARRISNFNSIHGASHDGPGSLDPHPHLRGTRGRMMAVQSSVKTAARP